MAKACPLLSDFDRDHVGTILARSSIVDNGGFGSELHSDDVEIHVMTGQARKNNVGGLIISPPTDIVISHCAGWRETDRLPSITAESLASGEL